MRDISAKSNTLRIARATSSVSAQHETIERVRRGDVPKSDPLPVARVAAIQAAKHTSQIIPYCHPLPVDFVGVDFELQEDRIDISVTVKAIYKTGVEMEALTAASVAALTIYDMLKMIDKTMMIGETRLEKKSGGKSSFRQSMPRTLRAGVLVMSDSIVKGTKSDLSGKLIVERLEAEAIEIAEYKIVPDDPDVIRETVKAWCDDHKLDLVVTTGGTGVTPRDNTPEALSGLLERELPGVAEAMRAYGQDRTHYSMLSRSLAGVRGQTILLAMPGSKKGVADSLNAIFPAILHGFKMVWGGKFATHDTPKSEFVS
jgi:molybdenum cofactor biosynthesis protein MoaC